MLVLCEAFSKYYKTTQKFWFIETLHYNCNWFVHNQVLVTNFLKKSIDWLIFSDAHLFKVVNPLLSDILSLFSWKYQETGGFQLFFFVVVFSVGGGEGESKGNVLKSLNSLNAQVPIIQKPVNWLTGFYIEATLAFSELININKKQVTTWPFVL